MSLPTKTHPFYARSPIVLQELAAARAHELRQLGLEIKHIHQEPSVFQLKLIV